MQKKTCNKFSKLNINELSEQEVVENLFLLTQQQREDRNTASKLRSALHRYDGQRLMARLQDDGVDTGTRTFDHVDGFKVEASLTPKVQWDQELLSKAFDDLQQKHGSDAAKHYADVKLSVSERKYKNAPPEIKNILQKARTVVVPDEASFKITENKGE